MKTFCYRCLCGQTKEIRRNTVPRRPACTCGRVMRRDFKTEAVQISPAATPTRRVK